MPTDKDDKWVTLESYDQLRDKFSNQGVDVNQKARDHVVAALRKLADHIESNRSPYLYMYDVKQYEKAFTETKICLSVPWGG